MAERDKADKDHVWYNKAVRNQIMSSTLIGVASDAPPTKEPPAGAYRRWSPQR